MSSYFRQQLETWLQMIDIKADRVLDVGGGANPVKNRVRSWDVKDYKILDNELEEMKQKPDIICDLNKFYERMAGHNGVYTDVPGAQGDEVVGVDRFPVIENQGSESYMEYFDVIFFLEVAEYIWDPVQALKNINRFLRPGGVFYSSWPFIYPHHNPEGRDYLRYTKWGVRKLLKETGFEIDEMRARRQRIDIDYNDPSGHPQPQQEDIKAWYSSQKMHPSKSGVDHNEIGYLVKAIKYEKNL